MPVSLPIPDMIPQLFVVLVHGEVPPAAELRRATQAWLADRVQGRLATLLPRFVDGVVQFEKVERHEIPLPSIGMLRHLGLGVEEESVLHAATAGVVVTGADVPAAPRAGYWATLCAARAVAAALGGVILDPSQRRIRPLDEAHEAPPRDARLVVSRHILVPTSRGDAGGAWMTTLGMDRFGLPNLEMLGVPEHLTRAANQMLNGVAQALIEGQEAHAQIEAPMELDVLELHAPHLARALAQPLDLGGFCAVGLRLTTAEDREPLVRLHPPEGPDADLAIWLVDATDALAPSRRGVEVVHVDPSDASLQEAMVRAMAELDDIRHRFLRDRADGDVVYVKASFPTAGGGLEFMWVAIEAWTEECIEGRLASEPELVEQLVAGQVVQVEVDDVCDWMWMHEDGTREGGYTIDALAERDTG